MLYPVEHNYFSEVMVSFCQLAFYYTHFVKLILIGCCDKIYNLWLINNKK